MIDEQWLAEAVAFTDELLTNPVHRGVVQKVKDAITVGFRDQVQAAVAESQRYVESALATGVLKSQHCVAARANPQWVRYALFEALIVWTNGLGRVCVHNPSARAPQPVYAAMWRPRVMVCARCTPLLGCRGLSAQERTCPNCRRITAGPGTDDRLHLHGIQSGALTFSFAVCADCRYWEHSDEPC